MKWGIKIIDTDRAVNRFREAGQWTLTSRGWEAWATLDEEQERCAEFSDLNVAHATIKEYGPDWATITYQVEELP